MSFAFFVLGFGLGLAAIAFAVEFVYNRLKNVRNQKQYSNTIGIEIKPIRKSKPAIITKMPLVMGAPILDIPEVPTAVKISLVGTTEIPK
jgi:lipoate synthase